MGIIYIKKLFVNQMWILQFETHETGMIISTGETL